MTKLSVSSTAPSLILVAAGGLTVVTVYSPLAAAAVVAGCLFLWSFFWRIRPFFALHFTIAAVALIAVPILRLTSAENSLRVAVTAAVLTTSISVAARTRGGASSGGLVPLLVVFSGMTLLSTALTPDPNEWSFFGLEVAVAFAAVTFARAAAQIHAWPTAVRVLVLIMASEAALGIYEVLALHQPIWRGGRIMADGSSTWIRNELVSTLPRAQGTFGHPLPFAFVLIVASLLVLRMRIWPWFIRGALYCLLGCGVFVSGSRNAIILFVLLSTLAFILPSILTRLHVVGTLSVIAGVVVSPFVLNKLGELVDSGSVDHRLGAINAIGALTQKRDFVQVIIGDGSGSAPRLFDAGLLQNDGFAAVDNQYVLTLAQNGIFGVIILIAILGIAARRGATTLRILLLAVAVTGMIFDMLAWPAVGFIVWFVIAAAWCRTSLADATESEVPQSAGQGTVVASSRIRST